MKTSHLISSLAVVGSIACAALPSAAAAATPSNAATSANWSGYVAGGTQFSSVSGSWVEPSAKCSSGQGYSSFWVGLGGADNESQALEQVGTEMDCSASGSSSHHAWYELVPAAPVNLDLNISPGDHMTGKVTVDGTNVTVSLSDQTTGQSATKNLQMDNPDVSSAEWIAEAPSQCDGSGCQPLSLADFGNVSFSNATATANGHTGTIADSSWSAQPVELDGSSAGGGFISDTPSATALPSNLSSDGSSFSVSWSANGGQTATAGDPGASAGSDPGASAGSDPGTSGYPGDGSSGGYGSGGAGYSYGGGGDYGSGGYGGGGYSYGGGGYSYGGGGYGDGGATIVVPYAYGYGDAGLIG